MAAAAPSACSEQGSGQLQIQGGGDLEVGAAGLQHLNRPAEALKQGRVIGDLPTGLLSLLMGLAQLGYWEPLRRLSCPQLGAPSRAGPR